MIFSRQERTRLPENALARSVFGPLGGVVETGAVNATGTWRLRDVSLGVFVAQRQSDLDRLLDGIRSVCRFSDAAMAIAGELGYLEDHEVSAASLLLWSDGIMGVPDPLDRIEEPSLVRRMGQIGVDLQLTRLLQALVTAALAEGTEAGEGAAGIAEILRVAGGLAEPAEGGPTPADIHRMWRVALLHGILRPASEVPDWGKAGYRAYDAELARLVQGE
ncbi:hypothetical protein [Streptomyces violarus]|uniref:Uncharacterized protein n=1 Tax=Streptomyces violarus TaxID=67380 RepID=A0A7W5F1D4_9ACTN|nr:MULTISPECIES: hypothetical protein [Streptomyces]MBB3076396.1 hypothetical protein [Streptomyces violarus]WRT99201.1 hypothetical protein VJ737_16540 [Streptomyces sp. CGMCC 4.1772]